MRKVIVIGSGGSGKSVFSRRLGDRLGIKVVHLDKEHWRPGWVEPSKEEWRRRVEQLVVGESWVLDGNYSGTLDVRLAACDTVIFLDLPRSLCLRRVLKRLVMYRRGGRPDVTEGCRERFDLKFMRWVWNYPLNTRPKIVELLERSAASKRVVRLRSSAEVEGFFSEFDDKK
jgi:adenylate kinase family enzyme